MATLFPVCRESGIRRRRGRWIQFSGASIRQVVGEFCRKRPVVTQPPEFVERTHANAVESRSPVPGNEHVVDVKGLMLVVEKIQSWLGFLTHGLSSEGVVGAAESELLQLACDVAERVSRMLSVEPGVRIEISRDHGRFAFDERPIVFKDCNEVWYVMYGLPQHPDREQLERKGSNDLDR